MKDERKKEAYSQGQRAAERGESCAKYVAAYSKELFSEFLRGYFDKTKQLNKTKSS